MTSIPSTSKQQIKTKILIISDTHGLTFANTLQPEEKVDVVIHCGDLTEHSTLAEFKTTISLLKSLKADLKLFIAGNHDFSLDETSFAEKILEAKRLFTEPIPDTLFQRDFGVAGEALNLLRNNTVPNLFFLEEGNYQFRLKNSAILKIYATPFTPGNDAGWGFQYKTNHEFSIDASPDIVISHGPPLGILDKDKNKSKRLGCARLFEAIAKAQPKIHCFGHIHSSWGARVVTWKQPLSNSPSHFVDIEHSKSRTLATLAMPQTGVYSSSHCAEDSYPVGDGSTLFVNAANKGDETELSQMPQIIEIELPISENLGITKTIAKRKASDDINDRSSKQMN